MSRKTVAPAAGGNPHYMTPEAYRKKLDDESWSRDARKAGDLYHQLADKRYPPGVAAGLYYPPTSTLLRCYEADPEHVWASVDEMLGLPQSPGIWQRAAALAARAIRDQRWSELGGVAFRVDRALTACLGTVKSAANTLDSPESLASIPTSGDTEKGIKLSQVLRSILDPSPKKLGEDTYLEVATSFFAAIPKHAPVPVALTEGADCETWLLMHHLWRNHRSVWTRHPEAIDRLGKLPHPFLSFLADQLRRHKATDDPESSEVESSEAEQPSAEPEADPLDEVFDLHSFDVPDAPPHRPETNRPVDPEIQATAPSKSDVPDWLTAAWRWIDRHWQAVRARFQTRGDK